MSGDFLGVGWQFPVGPGAEPGDIALARYEDSVSQAIWLILRTSPGERVMRPDFGCGLDDFVFALASAQTATSIATEVTQALTRWEPRADLLDVQVTPDADLGNALRVEISYRVRATNNVFNLVYPFYLEQAAG